MQTLWLTRFNPLVSVSQRPLSMPSETCGEHDWQGCMLQQARRCMRFGLNPRPYTPDEVSTPWLRSARPFQAMAEGRKRCHDRCCEDADQSLKKTRFHNSLSVQTDRATPSQMRNTMAPASRSSHVNERQISEEK